MDRHVEIRPEHLGHRGLGTQFTTGGHPGYRPERVQPVGLGLDPRISDPVREGCLISGPDWTSKVPPTAQGCQEACRAASDIPRSLLDVLIAARQPSLHRR